MKHVYCLLLAVIFYSAGSCNAAARPPFDPGKTCSKNSDTAAAKKAQVKISIAPAAQPAAKPAPKKEEKRENRDLSPLSWRPSFLY